MKPDLCRKCQNHACPDRCHPSSCELYTEKLNSIKEKRTRIEFRVYDLGVN